MKGKPKSGLGSTFWTQGAKLIPDSGEMESRFDEKWGLGARRDPGGSKSQGEFWILGVSFRALPPGGARAVLALLLMLLSMLKKGRRPKEKEKAINTFFGISEFESESSESVKSESNSESLKKCLVLCKIELFMFLNAKENDNDKRILPKSGYDVTRQLNHNKRKRKHAVSISYSSSEDVPLSKNIEVNYSRFDFCKITIQRDFLFVSAKAVGENSVDLRRKSGQKAISQVLNIVTKESKVKFLRFDIHRTVILRKSLFFLAKATGARVVDLTKKIDKIAKQRSLNNAIKKSKVTVDSDFENVKIFGFYGLFSSNFTGAGIFEQKRIIEDDGVTNRDLYFLTSFEIGLLPKFDHVSRREFSIISKVRFDIFSNFEKSENMIASGEIFVPILETKEMERFLRSRSMASGRKVNDMYNELVGLYFLLA